MNYAFCPMCGHEQSAYNRLVQSGDVPRIAMFECENSVCRHQAWNNPVPVAAAVIETPAGVVLVRNHGWPEKMFALVTGFVEFNEHPATTVIREVKEELGVDAELVAPLDYILFEKRNQLLFGFHVKTLATEFVFNEEIAEAKIIPIEKLKPWDFGTGVFIKNFLDR